MRSHRIDRRFIATKAGGNVDKLGLFFAEPDSGHLGWVNESRHGRSLIPALAFALAPILTFGQTQNMLANNIALDLGRTTANRG